jgi:hypothetical protein
MLYAQFFQKDLAGNVNEGCGDRAVIILDARRARSTNMEIAKEWCKKRGYIAYQLFYGDSFSRSKPASLLEILGN